MNLFPNVEYFLDQSLYLAWNMGQTFPALAQTVHTLFSATRGIGKLLTHWELEREFGFLNTRPEWLVRDTSGCSCYHILVAVVWGRPFCNRVLPGSRGFSLCK